MLYEVITIPAARRNQNPAVCPYGDVASEIIFSAGPVGKYPSGMEITIQYAVRIVPGDKQILVCAVIGVPGDKNLAVSLYGCGVGFIVAKTEILYDNAILTKGRVRCRARRCTQKQENNRITSYNVCYTKLLRYPQASPPCSDTRWERRAVLCFPRRCEIP